jgi:hypothetical protein
VYVYITYMSSTSSQPTKPPKLPPLPRKGNRTIYLADDALWEKAKALAGKDGISSVISRALSDYVSQRTAEESTSKRFCFELLDAKDPELPVIEVIGFEGRILFSNSFDLDLNPFDESRQRVETVIQIYRTKLGTFVLLAAPATDNPESASTFYLYEKHSSIRDLMSGSCVACLFPPDRHDLLTELTKSLGKDAITWID